MPNSQSTEELLELVRSGDEDAIAILWKQYFPKLVHRARRELAGRDWGVANEEDVALSAFKSFCQRAKKGNFPDLQKQDDLWRLLVTITARKATNLAKMEQRVKRGGPRRDHRKLASGCEAAHRELEQYATREPTPDMAVLILEQYQELLGSLGNQNLLKVAQWKIEGYTNQEIATKMGCVPRTVERRLQEIRALWEKVER
ncbi:MAG: ECF-type sigma factor [Gemmataceae bacterium]